MFFTPDQNNCGLLPRWVRVVKVELLCFNRSKRLGNKLQQLNMFLKLSSFYLKCKTNILDFIFLIQMQNSSHHI